MTDIFIFLDTYWAYDYVVDYVNYVVQRLHINAQGSSVTLLSARDGSVMVNRTFSITNYYENWNRTSHSWFRTGFSLPSVLSKAQELAETIMKEEREAAPLGGRSMIALIVPSSTAFIYDYDYDYCRDYLKYLNVSLPELTFLYYAGGAVIRFKDFVSNDHEDLFVLNYDIEVKKVAEPLVKRIRKVPRRLTNPRCSAYWSSLSSGSNQIIQYQRLGHINFYRFMPHYFFSEGSMRYLKIKPVSSIAFAICISRSDPWPYRNPLMPYAKGVECQQITTGDFSYDMGDLCLNYGTLKDCPPLYVSVQSQSFATSEQLTCKEGACTTPHQSQFLIIVNNLDCTSKASGRTKFKHVSYLAVVCLVFKILHAEK